VVVPRQSYLREWKTQVLDEFPYTEGHNNTFFIRNETKVCWYQIYALQSVRRLLSTDLLHM